MPSVTVRVLFRLLLLRSICRACIQLIFSQEQMSLRHTRNSLSKGSARQQSVSGGVHAGVQLLQNKDAKHT